MPEDFEKVLNEYTILGYRLIAFGYKRLDNMNYLKIQKTQREDVEKDLVFLGFLITENKLKEATEGTIKILNDSKIRTIMATGDNTLTAISVAKNCGILKKEQTVYYCDIEDNKLIWKKADQLEIPVEEEQQDRMNSGVNNSIVGQGLEIILERPESIHTDIKSSEFNGNGV